MFKGCVKTGAIVYWSNYDFKCSADVYRVGNCIIVRTHPGQVPHGGGERDQNPDMMIHWPSNCEEFWRPDIGVFVVPERCVEYYTNAEWTNPEHRVR